MGVPQIRPHRRNLADLMRPAVLTTNDSSEEQGIDQMIEKNRNVRSIHWAVKLLLTVLGGGLFPMAVLMMPPDMFPISVPDEHAGSVSVAVVLIVTFVTPTVLHLREGDSLRRSLLMGLVFAVVGSTLLFVAGYGLIVWMERLLMI